MLSRFVQVCRGLLLLLLCLAGPLSAAAQPYALSMRQLRHATWGRPEGVPALTFAMAETADGFLWLASRNGLYRFDGLSFELMDGEIDRDVYGTPGEVLVGRDGAVWAWYPKGWLAVYRQGRVNLIRALAPGGEVATFNQTRDGAIWLGVAQIGQPFLRYRDGRWDRVSPNPNREMLRDAFESADGAFWLTYNRSVLRRPPKGDRFERVDVPVTEGTLLAADPQGAVWMAGPNGGRRLTGPNGQWPGPPSRLVRWRSADPSWQAAAFDPSGNLWVRGRDFGRVPGLVSSERAGATQLAYEDGEATLMTSSRPSGLFVDRRGNVWYGGPRSLDRFSVPSVIVEPGLTNATKYGDRLFTASSGAVYIGQSDAVYRVDPRGRPVRLFTTTTEPEAICEDREGAIWIVLGDRVVRLLNGQRTTLERPFAETGVYECGSDPSGRFWMTASTNGAYWRDGATWRSVTTAGGSAAFEPTLKASDPQGRLWILTDPQTLTRLDGRFAEARPIDTKPRLGEVRALHATSLGLLLAGSNGAALVSPSGVVQLADKQSKSLRKAIGLVETPEGDTWAYGPVGLARFKTADLAKAFADPAFVIPQRVFGYEDGLLNQPNAQSWGTMVRGGDGRLWLATIDGVAWVDPAHLPSNATAPGVAISSLASGAMTVKDPVKVRLQPGASNITIGFAAFDLTMPERVKVLYRLDGHDTEWVDPGARRQAFYTNLAPGTYRFHVIAANENGVWNRVGDTLEVSLPPTFLQSIWFKLIVVAALMSLVWALYSLRVRQVSAALEARFLVRTAERERIARELHDTLLQGFQALMLRFQAVSNKLPKDHPLHQDLEQALDRADTVLAEGRSRVRDLRSQAAKGDLAEAIVDIASDFDGLAPPIDIVIEGSSSPTTPLVGEEVLRIAQEAIRNAVSHAQATRISVVLTFSPRHLALVVSDDGIGLPAEVREAGERAGHYGLQGMRERAERIGGRLTIETKPKGGTKVSVQAPAGAAYANVPGPYSVLRRLGLWRTKDR
jgi:signal transduction histidine kinase/ligand-binding sensor domain-containing protein